MLVRARPIEKATLGTAVHGAAEAVRGFQSLEQYRDQQRRIDEESKRRDEELNLRKAHLAATLDNMDSRTARWLYQQKLAEQKRSEEATKESGALQGDRAAIDALHTDLFRRMGGEFMAPDVAGPRQDSPIPPELQQQFDTITANVDAGTISHQDAAEQIKQLGVLAATALKGHAMRQLSDALHNETAAGYWTPDEALGVQIDVDADGNPDPVSSVPEFLMNKLAEGADPEEVDAIHRRLKDDFDREKAHGINREAKIAEWDTALAERRPSMSPDDFALAYSVRQRMKRREYPDTAEGMQQADRDYQQALNGMAPVEIDGVQVYAPLADVKAGRVGKEQPRPEIKHAEEVLGALKGVVPPFKPDPTSDDDAETQFKKWFDLAETIAAKFGLSLKFQAPVPTVTTPSRGALITRRSPESAAAPVDIDEQLSKLTPDERAFFDAERARLQGKKDKATPSARPAGQYRNPRR